LCLACVATMVRSGEDIVTVAELLGHSVETARRYSLPTERDKRRAIQRIPSTSNPPPLTLSCRDG